MFSDNSVVKNTTYYMGGIKKEILSRFVPDGVSVLVEKDRLLVKGLAPYQALSVLLRK